MCLRVEYNKFRLFQLSLLWRAGVSSRAEFNSVELGEHVDRLRDMIIDRDPGEPGEYGCVIVAPSIPRPDIIMPPEVIRHRGEQYCRFLLGGIFWIFSVSSNLREPLDGEKVLSRDGILPVLVDSKHADRFLMDLALDLRRKGKLPL